jgi:hypothetical protein
VLRYPPTTWLQGSLNSPRHGADCSSRRYRRAAPSAPGWGRVSEHPARRGHDPGAPRLRRPILEPSSPRSTTMKLDGKPYVAGVGCPSTRRDRSILRRVGKRSATHRSQEPCHLVDCASLTHSTHRRMPHFGTMSIHLDPCRCSQQIMSRELQPRNRQVRVVYRCWNSAGKPQFSASFGHARRAFQPAFQAQHVVAAT